MSYNHSTVEVDSLNNELEETRKHLQKLSAEKEVAAETFYSELKRITAENERTKKELKSAEVFNLSCA